MTVFDQQYIQLRVTDDVTYSKESSRLMTSTSKAVLMELAHEISRVLPGPYVIVKDGIEVPNPEYYIPQKKYYAFKSAEAANFVAVFFHNPENLNLYWSRVPEIYKDLVKMLVSDGYIEASDAIRRGFGSIISIEKSRYSFEPDVCHISDHDVWFSVEISAGDNDNYWDAVPYLTLNKNFSNLAAKSLGVSFANVFEHLPPELKPVSAESEAIGTVPLIEATLKQGTLKFSRARVTAASSWKFMKATPIREILPDFTEYGDKFNCGQTFLPLFNSLSEKALSKSPVDVLHSAAERLFRLENDLLIPMLMPHIKGFKAGSLHYRPFYGRTCLKELLLASSSNDWLALKPIVTWLGINSMTFLDRSIIREMSLDDPVYVGRVTLDRVYAFECSLLGGLCTALYCLGMAELALAPIPEVCADLYSHICAVRLTPLGRYAFGLSSSYEAPAVKHDTLFELDEKHLIIRSLQPGNPYESLLADTSSSIGSGRFVMSPESFLKNCKTRKDVADKVAFFRQYICPDPPGVWTEFFKTVEHRCNPFSLTNERYDVYTVDSSDTYLVNLLTTDTVLKEIVIRAEGYRILVPASRHTVFVNRLKTFGYLL